MFCILLNNVLLPTSLLWLQSKETKGKRKKEDKKGFHLLSTDDDRARITGWMFPSLCFKKKRREIGVDDYCFSSCLVKLISHFEDLLVFHTLIFTGLLAKF